MKLTELLMGRLLFWRWRISWFL